MIEPEVGSVNFQINFFIMIFLFIYSSIFVISKNKLFVCILCLDYLDVMFDSSEFTGVWQSVLSFVDASVIRLRSDFRYKKESIFLYPETVSNNM